MSEILNADAVAWAKRRWSEKDALAKVVVNVAKICDSHESLRVALTHERVLRAQLRTWLEVEGQRQCELHLQAQPFGKVSPHGWNALMLRDVLAKLAELESSAQPLTREDV